MLHTRTEIRGIQFASLLAIMFVAVPLTAAPDDWAEGSPGQEDGATITYYNNRGQLAWRNPEGDWRDAEGVQQGKKPFATVAVIRKNEAQTFEWDITALVRDWASGKARNKGVLLRNMKATGLVHFRSRESKAVKDRPQLILTVNGQPKAFDAVADTFLHRSTVRPLGQTDYIQVEGVLPALIRFNLDGLKKTDTIDKAVLRLVSHMQYENGEIGVFACDQGEEVQPLEPRLGLAAKFPSDRGIDKNPDVIFATGFEAEDWKKEWSQAGGKVETIVADPRNKFDSLSGKACRSTMAKGENLAMNLIYQFQKKIGSEPEEIYFRYYLRFGDDWHQTVDGGKMPGVSGTYGDAGWGGRKVNGKDGWSARGIFGRTFPEGNPLAGKQPLGWYCYHADMELDYGDGWLWTKGYRGFLDNNRWYCIEQYVKMNTPGKNGGKGANDGILRVWIDGRPAYEKTDIRFRDIDKLKIEQIWMNIYHGGVSPSPRDQHVYVDNVVIAKKYIGPMK